MDQVKVILGYAQKYHFWILCVVAMLAGLVGWYLASGTLSEQYIANKGSVTGKFQSLDGVLNNSSPPNADWTTALASLTSQQSKDVEATWKAVYAVQSEVLDWPQVMPEEFRQWIKAVPPSEEIPGLWRSAYQTEVHKNEFPKLARIVGAGPVEADDKKNENATTPSFKVDWQNQEAVGKALSFPTGAPPSSLQIRLRQEDYWVYQALLSIIAKANEGSAYTPRVKVIEEVSIGAATASKFEKGMGAGHITALVKSEGGDDVGGGGYAPEASGGEDAGPPAPDQGRYVDAEGKSLPAGTAQEQQFKRLPVYLRLVMDQREITRLLTECANYPLPVEVRQLRINPGGSGPGVGGDSRQKNAAPRTPLPGEIYDVLVEIHGIIYLFNPPDGNKLGGDASGQFAG